MKESKETIYLTQEGYNQYLANIEQKRLEVQRIYAEKKNETSNTSRERYISAGMADLDRKERALLEEIGRLTRNLKRIEIVDKPQNENVVNLNDTILIDMIYSSDESEEVTVKLVEFVSGVSDIQEVSIYCPLGKALQGKQIGEMTSYSANEQEIQVHIKQKLTLDEPLKR